MTYNGLSMNTILPTMDMWQYSMLPLGTLPSLAYPQDSLSSLNDQNLFKFNCYAGNVLNQTAMTNQFVDNWAQQFNARLTQWYQNMMSNLSFNTNITGWPGFPGMPSITGGCNCGHAGRSGRAGGAEGVDKKKDKMDDLTVWKYMARLGSVDTYGDKVKEKVTLKDGTKSTYVDRLTQLCKDYVTDNKLGLSASEFEACKDAAEKMKESGKIDKSDYTALKAIVENHLGKKEKAEGEDDGDKEDKQVVRPDKYLQEYADAEAGSPNNYKALSEELYQKLYNSDATEDDMALVTKHIDKYNVLNVAKDFKDNYGDLEEENLVDAIFADCTRWGKYSSIDGLKNFTTDDAKPAITKISKALVDRANDIIKRNPDMDKDTKAELQSLAKSLTQSVNSVERSTVGRIVNVPLGGIVFSALSDEIKNESKQNVSESFQALADKLQEVENDIYGELDV